MPMTSWLGSAWMATVQLMSCTEARHCLAALVCPPAFGVGGLPLMVYF